jgi:hypothetical protein
MANYLGGGGFDPQAYMMRKMMDELFGDQDDISKQNAQTRYTNTVNLYAGNIDVNWDSGDLGQRKKDITTFHSKIKKSPNYDPIIEDHINVIQRQIDNRMRMNDNFNLNIDRLKNIDSQLISIADEYRAGYDKRKEESVVGVDPSSIAWDPASDAELRIITDKAKKMSIDRADATSMLQKIDPRRWQSSSELQFLSKDAKTNSGYLMSAIKNDGFIDNYEYGKLMESIDADDPTIITAAMNTRDAQVLQINKGLIEETQALGVDTKDLYETIQIGIKNKTLKGSALLSAQDSFAESLDQLMRKKFLIGEGSGKGMEEEVWNNIFTDGEVPWKDYKIGGGAPGIDPGGDPPPGIKIPEEHISRFEKGYEEYTKMDWWGNLPGGKKPSFGQHDKTIFKKFEKAKERDESITLKDFISHRPEVYDDWTKKEDELGEKKAKRLKHGQLTKGELKLWRQDIGKLKDSSLRQFFGRQGTFTGSSEHNYKNVVRKLNGKQVRFHLTRNEQGRLEVSKQHQNVYTGKFGNIAKSSIEEFNKSV